LTYTVAQPHDAAGRQRRQLIDDVSPMGSLSHRKPAQRNPTTCGRHSASSMVPAATQRLVRTTWEAVAAIAIASPSPRAELNLYQRGKAR